MKYILSLCFLSTILLLISPSTVLSKSSEMFARVDGMVYDENRVPVSDVHVELSNEVGSMLASTKTNSSGRFSFAGLSTGRFSVTVKPFGTNFLEETKDFEIVPGIRGQANDFVSLEFYLRVDRRTRDVSTDKAPEALFVQEIPPDAKKAYEMATDSLNKNQDIGLAELDVAITKFPTYFDALSRLGKEYLVRKDYEKAYPYLIRAIDVNPRSYSSYYGLGYSFYQLKMIPAALKAAEACTILNANSTAAHLLYGTLLRIDGQYDVAEKELVKAKSLAKKPDAEVHWQLALLFNRLKRNKEAADELEIYLKLNPEAPDKKRIQDLIAKLKEPKQA